MSQGYPTSTTGQGNGMAVAALVTGMIGLVLGVATGWIPCVGLFIPLVPTLLAVIFGGVGMSRARQGAPHGGIATAGLACGVLGLVITIGFQGLWGLAIKMGVDEAGGIQGLQQKIEKAGEEFEAEMKRLEEEMEKEQSKFEIPIEDEKKAEPAKPDAAAPKEGARPGETESTVKESPPETNGSR
jgi:hypothetical protein